MPNYKIFFGANAPYANSPYLYAIFALPFLTTFSYHIAINSQTEPAMYQYSYADQALVNERVAQYRRQTERYLAGELPEDEFLPIRLLKTGEYLA